MKILNENKLQGLSSLYIALKKYIRNQIDKEELRMSDDLIYDVIKNSNDLSKTRIYIDFDTDDELLELFGIDEEDINFIGYVESGNYEFFDSYSMKEDFLEGYTVLNELNEENEEILMNIVNTTFGQSYDLSNYEDRQKVAEFLYDAYRDECDDMIQHAAMHKDELANDGAQIYIERELNEYFRMLGFVVNNRWDKVSISVENLFEMYASTGKLKLDLQELIRYKVENLSSNQIPGGFWDDMYEYPNLSNLSDDRYQRSLNKILENLWEEVQEQTEVIPDYFTNLKELSKQFKFNKWYDLPKSKDIKFKLDKLDRETGKVILYLSKSKSGNMKKTSISFENIQNFLYHPELFDLNYLFN